MANGLFFNWDELEWIVMSAQMRRKQVWLGKLMNIKMEIQPGTKAAVHSHFHEQTGTVIQGKLKVIIGEEERILTPGAGYIIPSNVPHSVEALGGEPTVMLETFTPPREDLIE